MMVAQVLNVLNTTGLHTLKDFEAFELYLNFLKKDLLILERVCVCTKRGGQREREA